MANINSITTIIYCLRNLNYNEKYIKCQRIQFYSVFKSSFHFLDEKLKIFLIALLWFITSRDNSSVEVL